MNITKITNSFFPDTYNYFMGNQFILHITKEEYEELTALGKPYDNGIGRIMTPFSSLPIEVAETLRGRVMNKHGYKELLKNEAELIAELKEIQSKIKSLES